MKLAELDPVLDVDTVKRARPHVHPAWLILLLGLSYAGYVKGISAFSVLSVDLTLIFAGICLFGVLSTVARGRAISQPALIAVLGLWLCFTIGVVNGLFTGAGPAKSLLLLTVTFLCAVCPAFFVPEERSLHLFLRTVVVAGLVVAVALFLFPDLQSEQAFGRRSLEGSNTIALGRMTGAAAVVAFVMVCARSRAWWVWLAVLAGSSAALVSIGSRGPFVSFVLASVLVLVLARRFRGRRLVATLLGALVLLGGLAVLVVRSNSLAAARLVGLFSAGDVDQARTFLLRQAVHQIAHHPLGLGWGGFQALPEVRNVYGGRLVYPHNMVVEVFVEGGWLAGLLFVILIVYSLRCQVSWSGSVEAASVLALTVYWVLVAQTSSDINGNRTTWVMLGIGLAMGFRNRQSDDVAARLPSSAVT